jgi:hypothetical protein
VRFRHSFALALVILLLVSLIGADGTVSKSTQGTYYHILSSQFETHVATSTPALNNPGMFASNLAMSISYYNLNLTSTYGGTTSPAPGVYPRPSRDNFTITSTPFPHNLFDHWQLDGVSAGASNPITVFMNMNRTLQAVFVALPNQPPMLSVPGPQIVDEGSNLNFKVNATDADVPMETVTLSVQGMPAGATFDPSIGSFVNGNPASGIFSWTAGEGQGPADYLIIFRATDNGSPAFSDVRTVPIHVNEANIPPSLTVPSRMVVNKLTTLSFNVTASDPDLPPEQLTLSAVSIPPGAHFDVAGGVFSWTPTEAQGPGDFTATFKVSDGSLTDVKGVNITVNEVNHPPVLSVPNAQTVDPGTLLTFTVIATDPDLPPEPLRLSASGMPPGASFDPGTGTFSWTPAQSLGPSVYNVAFTVDDGNGGVTTHRVTITLKPSILASSVLPQPTGFGLLWYFLIFLLVVETIAIIVLRRGRRRNASASSRNMGGGIGR